MESGKNNPGRSAGHPANASLLNKELQAARRAGLRFSVIIPAHNAEKTLRRAVESVRAALGSSGAAPGEGLSIADLPLAAGAEEKKIPFYEILVVENGSEDGTEFLARTLQLENPETVRFLMSEKGVSNARNRGLDEARGEWVLFLDADDYFTEQAAEVLREDLFFSATDLIVHSYYAGKRLLHACPSSGERFAGSEAGKDDSALSGKAAAPALAGTVEEASVRMIENPTRYTSVWSKLFRRERIEYARLRFDPALRLSEDSHFLIRFLASCRRIRFLDRPFYHYSTDNPSVVRSWDPRKEDDYRASLTAVRSFLQTQPEQVRRAFAGYGMMQFNLLMVRGVFASASPLSMAEGIRRMKEISEKEPFASALRAYDPARHKGARYLPIVLLKMGLAPAAAAVYAARALQNAKREM